MSEVRVKTKEVRDRELGDIFNQIIGAGRVNMQICVPKYLETVALLRKTVQILDIFANKSMFYQRIDDASSEDFRVFIERLNILLQAVNIDLTQYQSLNYNGVPDHVANDFSSKYNDLKQAPEIATMLRLCDNLIPYKKYIGDASALNYKFILLMPGVEFRPFPFSSLNVKQAVSELDSYKDAESRSNIELLMLVMGKLFNISHNIYKIISSPDADIDEFVDVVMTKIIDLRKKVPRCGKAFDKLVESVNLLKNNFSVYYRDFAETQSGTIIIENFVLDVAKNTRADPSLMKQFRDIVNYIRKVAGKNVNNPQAQMLFDKLNEQFSKFDKFSNIRADTKDKGTDGDADEGDDEGPIPIDASDDDGDMEARRENADKSVDELAAEIEAMGTTGKK